jgi:ribose transport system substrate-binding protein
MSRDGNDVPANIDVPFRMKQVAKGMCNRALPEDASVSTLLDNDMLKAMFSK